MTPQISVNDFAIDFCLDNTQGNKVQLSDFKGKQNVLLVFNRGYTCPFCRRHMANLKKDYSLFTERNTEIITVGPNTMKDYRRFWENMQIPFIGCSDTGNAVAKKYFQEFNLLKFGWVPALFVLDQQQKIRFRHYGRNMADIPENQILLDLIDQINQEKSY